MKDMMLMNLDKEIKMTSLEVVNMINRFRKEEGNRAELKHKEFLRKTRKEIDILKLAGYDSEKNFTLAEYLDEQGKPRPCYSMNRNAILQMAASESAIVRAKLIQYIEALENRLQTIQQQQIIVEKDKQIKRLEALVGLRSKDKFTYSKIIKRHLGIRKANADYENIKQMFFFELHVEKWEDITYSRKNVVLLQEICEDYKPNTQLSLF